MTLQGGGETRCGIGTRLRLGRERKGLTVLQAAEKLHVDARILESLESEDFAALGAAVYVRGHMRHYAELVGEQATELLDLYSSSTRAVQPDLTRIAKGIPAADPRNLVIPAVVIVVGFAIAGAVWWVLSISKGHLRTAQTPLPPSAASPAHEAVPLPPPPVVPEPVALEPSPQAKAAPAKAPTPTVPSAGGAKQTARVAAAAAPALASVALSAGGAPKPARSSELTLRFNGESWAEVYDSGGARLFYDVGAANSVRTFKGAAPLRVVLGNAPGVAVEVNGHPSNIAAVTHSDGSAQFVVNRSGRASQSQ